ncbi:Mdm20 protein [Candida orthopsilosis Co 90-125]|uniref:Mdm20 protein n=1 Tax=Candida orthopsilosis (strain 90-125) TaxID=1136231 RepID=H8X1J8_CANO9|nr:Mdm20 protein [Candida orthopsilosis Co 90-125]CCG22403.1 Mdm20 protein [Candida orthopsilosis Co 90-125]
MFSPSDEKIIEYIDAGQYAIAQSSLLDKIKKHPNKTIYRALLNKVLYKTGSTSKAIENNLALLKSTPNEISTVIELNEFFKSSGMEKEADLCFENPIQKYPLLSQELSSIWFENTIQDLNVKQFNKIFSFLNKSKKDRKYTFWYSFSFYLLINQGEEEKFKLNLYKQFGKKLIEGLVEKEPFANCQELYVYTRFLLSEADYDTIESILSGVKFPLDLEMQLLYMEAMKKSGKWSQLHNHASKLLLEDKFDDFDTWRLWIKSGYETGVSYQDIQSKLGNSRNELLTRIELDLLYKTEQDQLQEDIGVYFAKFKNKMCCFSDLSKYKDDLPLEFYNKVKSSTNEILVQSPQGDTDLITLVNNQKFAPQIKNGQIYQYFRGDQSVVTNRSEFDNDPLNDLLLISIIEKLSENPSPTQIIQSIAIIKQLLMKDKYNYRLKVWLIKLYSQLNTNDTILPIYESLKIKMIQHETLGHYLTNIAPATKSSLDEYIDIFRFYLTAKHEVKDTVLGGFESQIYSKLTSFIQFGQRLQNSASLNTILQKIIQTSLITSDKGYMNYFAHYLKENEKSILESAWRDNRDFESEWTGIVVNEKLETAKSNKLLSIPVHDQSTRLKLIVYAIVLNSSDNSPGLLKQFNKIVSSTPNVSHNPFTNVIFKMYYNLLKIQTNIKLDESQSLSNFILKNLKIDKLKSQIVPTSSILSYQFNENLINLVEFIKIVSFISTQSRGKTKDAIKTTKIILHATTNLVPDLKKLDFLQQQFKVIDEQVSFDLNDELEMGLEKTVLENAVNEVKESIAASTKSILNNI